MKKITIAFLLVINLFVSAMPYYNQDNAIVNKTEKQFEDLSFSEVFTNPLNKHTVILNPVKLLNNWIKKFLISTNRFLNFKTNKLVPEICKYGLQVWFCTFLN